MGSSRQMMKFRDEGIHQYGQCQSRAFIKGIFAFFAGGAAGLTTSFLIRHRYPKFPPVYNVVFVAGGAIVTSYVVALVASKQCQRQWVYTAQQHGPVGGEDVQSNSPRAVDTIAKDTIPVTSIRLKDGLQTTKYGDQMG